MKFDRVFYLQHFELLRRLLDLLHLALQRGEGRIDRRRLQLDLGLGLPALLALALFGRLRLRLWPQREEETLLIKPLP